MLNSYRLNTLRYDSGRCTGCEMCWTVCPHGVFTGEGRKARLARLAECMECGACALNCPAGAIAVESGVGCAAAIIKSVLTGSKVACC